jgi:hypothetical protein
LACKHAKLNTSTAGRAIAKAAAEVHPWHLIHSGSVTGWLCPYWHSLSARFTRL